MDPTTSHRTMCPKYEKTEVALTWHQCDITFSSNLVNPNPREYLLLQTSNRGPITELFYPLATCQSWRERERRNDRIRTYRSCIQHKNLEIVRNPEVAFWSWFDTIISFKTPPNYFTRDPLRSIGNKPIRVKFLTLHGCQVRLLTVRYACIQESPFSSAKG